MSCDLGLAIGESFAELVGFAEGTAAPSLRSRWYLPRKSLAEGFKEAVRGSDLADKKNATVWVTSNSVERILEKTQGRSPAVLVTAGFESWLKLRQPLVTPPFALKPQRRELPTEDDFVFGVSGRIGADGTILSPFEIQDLEFLTAKFEMLKIRDIAVTFLHAQKNPEHENSAAAYLREKGFRVFESHKQTGENETERFRKTIECAFAESAVLEEKERLEAAVKSVSEDWQLQIWSPKGPLPWADYSAVSLRGGLSEALNRASATKLSLHCGLDEFCVFGAGPENRCSFAWPIRPTQLIKHGAWPFPHLSNDFSGYAPGPMALGRSQQLAAIDVLFVREKLLDIEGLSPLLSEKSRSRILETLFTLAKSPIATPKKRPPDAKEIASDLERAFVEQAAIRLAASGAKGEVGMSGPLASAMLPLMKARRKDLRFTLMPEAAWQEAISACNRKPVGPEAKT
jgi:hypothetical protein